MEFFEAGLRSGSSFQYKGPSRPRMTDGRAWSNRLSRPQIDHGGGNSVVGVNWFTRPSPALRFKAIGKGG